MINTPLRFIHWNANGTKYKIDELKIILNKEKIDIELIGKTKLKSSINLKITNYFIYQSLHPVWT